ncbi:MAG: DUF4132 domain-containing protein, partial [Pseudomonadota bacterium]
MASLKQDFGQYQAEIRVSPPGQAVLLWSNKGQPLKRQPASIKRDYPEQLNAIKGKLAAIRATLSAQRQRIESFFLTGKSIPFNIWMEAFITHALVGSICQPLIWTFTAKKFAVAGIYKNNALLDVNDNEISLSNKAQVKLWHPLNATESEREAWRNYIWTHALEQPFRQAYREYYDGAESQRLATLLSGLYIRQHQFAALLRSKDWRYGLRGSFERDSHPYKALTEEYACEIQIDGESQSTSVHGICLAVGLGTLSFYKNGKPIDSYKVHL